MWHPGGLPAAPGAAPPAAGALGQAHAGGGRRALRLAVRGGLRLQEVRPLLRHRFHRGGCAAGSTVRRRRRAARALTLVPSPPPLALRALTHLTGLPPRLHLLPPLPPSLKLRLPLHSPPCAHPPRPHPSRRSTPPTPPTIWSTSSPTAWRGACSSPLAAPTAASTRRPPPRPGSSVSWWRLQAVAPGCGGWQQLVALKAGPAPLGRAVRSCWWQPAAATTPPLALQLLPLLPRGGCHCRRSALPSPSQPPPPCSPPRLPAGSGPAAGQGDCQPGGAARGADPGPQRLHKRVHRQAPGAAHHPAQGARAACWQPGWQPGRLSAAAGGLQMKGWGAADGGMPSL